MSFFFFFCKGLDCIIFGLLDFFFCMGQVEVWAIEWPGLFLLFISSTWIGLRVLIEGLLSCCGVEAKSELGYRGLPSQIGVVGAWCCHWITGWGGMGDNDTCRKSRMKCWWRHLG